MKYLGLDVHSRTSTWCLLDQQGEVVGRGQVSTDRAQLKRLVQRLAGEGKMVVGQEVGGMAYLVHDAISAVGVKVLSFNAQQLRMIAASRKKSDRRDAYWIARAIQSGMHPHPVYLPDGKIREMRGLLTRRRMVLGERTRWRNRARAAVRAVGRHAQRAPTHLRLVLEDVAQSAQDVPAGTTAMVELCQRQCAVLDRELKAINAELNQSAQANDAMVRLQTIPAIGPITAATIYAWVGDISRFPDARSLASYAGLVPTVRQSGEASIAGSITKCGAPQLRHTLVQAAHVLIGRSKGADALPLKQIAERIRGSRGRRRIATVELARHLLRIAFYILRDQTEYDHTKLHVSANDPDIAVNH